LKSKTKSLTIFTLFLAFIITFTAYVSLNVNNKTAFASEIVDTEQELAEALKAGGEVVLGGDVEVSSQITISEGVSATLDLNGKTIKAKGDESTTNHIYVLSNKGTLTINDSVGGGAIVSRGVYNYGELTLNNGTIEACDGNGGYAINNESGSVFTMNGGVVQATYDDDPTTFDTSDATAIDVSQGNVTTINGGTISCVSNWCYAISSSGTLNITNANNNIKVSGVHGAVAVSAGTATIEGGEFVCDGATNASSDHVLYCSNNAVLTVNGGSFTNNNTDSGSNGAAICVDGENGANVEVTVNGGKYVGCSTAITGNDKTVVNGGSFSVQLNNNYDTKQNVEEYLAPGATVEVEGEEITSAFVAKVGDVCYASFDQALNAVKSMTGDVVVELYDKVTLKSSFTGSYDKITFVGKSDKAEIYLEVQGYITATGKKVAFEELTLSKSAGGFINNAGFMNVAFGVYDVVEVNYTNCTFINGSYASSGKVTYTDCTFYKSHEKYGLWAYGDVDATVVGGKFSSLTENDDKVRGIKMYAEGAKKTTDLTVEDVDFSEVNEKPAIVLTYGESVTLKGNDYSSTGVFELDLDGSPDGTALTADITDIACKNDNGSCGVLVDGKIYTTVESAVSADVVKKGSEVTLMYAPANEIVLPYGVNLNTNNYANVSVKEADLTITTVQEFIDFANQVNSGNQYKDKIVVLGANIDLNGSETNLWTPIGENADGSKKFYGTFDGNDYVISNLYVKQGAGYHGAGLFGATCGEIRNFTIDGAYVESISSGSATVNGTAVVAGSTAYGATISNVHVKNATVKGNRYVAGIVGYMDGSVINCSVENVNITATPDNLTGSYDNGDKVGGIVGYCNSGAVEISACELKGELNITAYRDVAGIVGCLNSTVEVEVNENVNDADITITIDTVLCGERDNYNVGEFVGRNTPASTSKPNQTTPNATYTQKVFAPKGNIATGVVFDEGNGSYIYFDLSNLNAEKSIVIKVYSDDTLLATTTLVKDSYLSYSALSTKVCITATSSSWATTWEADKTYALVPNNAELYVDGVKVSSVDKINMYNTDNPANAREWWEIDGVTAPVEITLQNGQLKKFATLQSAIDFATATAGDYEIILNGQIDESIKIHQTESVNLTIKGDGENSIFTGYIKIYGHARSQGAETLTFDGIVFSTSVKNHLFIEQQTQTSQATSNEECYPHNVTIKNCEFIATGDAVNTAVGVKFRMAYNTVIKDVVSTDMHSLAQLTACANGVLIENVEIKGKNGISLNTSYNDITVKNVKIDALGYGLRADANNGQYETNLVVKDCQIEAFIPVVVRDVKADDYYISFAGTNVMTAENTDGIWCAIGATEYEENGVLPKATIIEIPVEITGTVDAGDAVLHQSIKPAGTGTENDPFVIANVEALEWFRDSVNAGTSYAGKFIVLSGDIDLEQKDWYSIGTSSFPFVGTFDGKGYTIYNLWCAEGENGLFGYTSTGNRADNSGYRATIKNLTINGAVVNDANQKHNGAGALVGCANMNTTVENVVLTGEIIISGSRAGGIVGYNYSGLLVDNCHVIGDTQTENSINALYWSAGGIVGFGGGSDSYNYVSNCSVKNVSVNAVNHYGAAAIVGNVIGSIENISAEDVTVTSAYAPEYNGLLSAGSKATGDSFAKDCELIVDGVKQETVEDMEAELNGVMYSKLATAIEKAQSNDTVKLIANFVLSNVIEVNKNLTLDLNGYTITVEGVASSRVIVLVDGCTNFVINANGGEINSYDGKAYGIIDVNTNADLIVNGGSYDFATNNGSLFKFRDYEVDITLNDVIVNTNGQISGPNGSKNVLTVNGGTFSAKNTYNARNVFAFYIGGAKATFNDITMENEYIGGIENYGGEVEVNNCDITVSGTNSAPYLSVAVAVDGMGNLTVNGGNYKTAPLSASDANGQGATHGSWTAMIMSSGGTLTINDGTFENGNYGDQPATYPREVLTVGADTIYGSKVDALLIINGGKFTSIGDVIHCETIWDQDGVGSDTASETIKIVGGEFEFNGLVIGGCNPVDTPNPVVVEMSGGVYSTFDEQEYIYLADGYKVAKLADDKFEISEIIVKTYEVGEGKTYANLNEAVAMAEADKADLVTYEIYGAVEFETGFAHAKLPLHVSNMVSQKAFATIIGMTDDARLTITGGGVPDIVDVTVKNIAFYDEGEYLPTANEFMYQNFINASFENVTFYDGIRLAGNSSVINCTVEASTSNEYAIWMDEGDFVIENSTVNVREGAYGMMKSDNADSITLTGNTLEFHCEAKKEALNTNGAEITASNNKFIDCIAGIVPEDKTNTVNGKTDIDEIKEVIAQDNQVTINYAIIGNVKYETLSQAIANANEGDVIKLILDVELDEAIVVGADKVITLDLNNLTLSGKSNVLGTCLIKNEGNLTIKNGVVTYEYTGAADPSFGKGNYTIVNGGILTVEEATIENTTAYEINHMHSAVDNNSTSRDVKLVLNSGKIVNEKYVAVRQFANSATYKNEVIVNGGEIIAGKRAVYVQLLNSNETNAVKASTVINDGVLTSYDDEYCLAVYVYGYSTNLTNVELRIFGGTFNGNVALNGKASLGMVEGQLEIAGGTFNGQDGVFGYDEIGFGFISGGTFVCEVPEEYWTPGFVVIYQDGAYVAMSMSEFSVIVAVSLREVAEQMIIQKVYNDAGVNAFENVVTTYCAQISNVLYMSEVERIVQSAMEAFNKVLTEIEAKELATEYSIAVKEYAELKKVDVKDSTVATAIENIYSYATKYDMMVALELAYEAIDQIALDKATALENAKTDAINTLMGANLENKNDVTSAMIASIYACDTVEKVEIALAVAQTELAEIKSYKALITNASNKASESATTISSVKTIVERIETNFGLDLETLKDNLSTALNELDLIKENAQTLVNNAVTKDILNTKVNEINSAISQVTDDVKQYIDEHVIDAITAQTQEMTLFKTTVENTINGLSNSFTQELSGVKTALQAIKPLTKAEVETILSTGLTNVETALTQIDGSLQANTNAINSAISQLTTSISIIADKVQALTDGLTNLNQLAVQAKQAADQAKALAEQAKASADNAKLAAELAKQAAEKVQTTEVKAHAALAKEDVEKWIEEYLNSLTSALSEGANDSASAFMVSTFDSTNAGTITSDTYRQQLEAKLDGNYTETNRKLILSYYDQVIAQINAAVSKAEIDLAVETFKTNVALVDTLETLTPAPRYNDTAVIVLLVVIVVVEAVIAVILLVKVLKAKKQNDDGNDGDDGEQQIVATEDEKVEGEEEVVESEDAQEESAEDVETESAFANIKGVSKTFEQKLSEADDLIKEGFATISEKLLGYKKVNQRVSKKAVSFRNGRKLIAKMTIVGKTLRVYLALDPNAYEVSKLFQKDASDKKAYEEVPMLLRVRSGRAIKRAVNVIPDLAEKFGLQIKPQPKE